jgi:hypothetical protein
MNTVHDIARANEPWDGVRRVQPPADYIRGLYRMHQLVADDLLRQCRSLSNWEATFLQVVRYQGGTLTPAQRHYLGKIEQRADGRVSA